jgi:hypothetical protein
MDASGLAGRGQNCTVNVRAAGADVKEAKAGVFSLAFRAPLRL